MDELLVHISAPATRKNDEMYRFLANAYAEFQPYQPDTIDAHNASNEQQQSSHGQRISGPEPIDRDGQKGSCEASTSTMSKDLYGSFPSNVSLEPLPQTEGDPAIHESSAGLSDDSSVDTSHVGRLELIQSNWKRNRKSRLGGSRSSFVAHTVAETFIEDTQLAACALHSQLPEDTTASQDISDDERDFSVPHLGVFKTHSPSQDSANLPIGSPEPFAAQHATNYGPKANLVGIFLPEVDMTTGDTDGSSNITPNSHGGPLKAISPNYPNSDGLAIEGSTKHSPLPSTLHSPQATPSVKTSNSIANTQSSELHVSPIDFSNLPFEVLPPGPKTSTNAPGALPSQVTKYLQVIKQQNRYRFAPSSRTRVLKPDERGYWLMETATWTEKLQYNFWSSLCDHVRKGDFGWGVFLHRDAQGPEGRTGTGVIGQVRLYCWGEIVEELWLALWLCSNGKLSVSGSKWVDAGDNIVMHVP